MKLAKVRHRIMASLLDLGVVIAFGVILAIFKLPFVISMLTTKEHTVTTKFIIDVFRWGILMSILLLVYYVVIPLLLNGQTLGKKLMRLKIVNNSNETCDVPVWSYIVRCLVLYQPISYIVKLIGVYFMNASMYYDISNFMVTIQGYVEMLVLAMIMIRLDGRGLQDILANTRVALYDRNGNEIKDKLELLVNEKVKGKKVIDEEPTELN